jgi:hypothetical protein
MDEIKERQPPVGYGTPQSPVYATKHGGKCMYHLLYNIKKLCIWHSRFGTVAGHGLEGRGLILGTGKIFSSFPRRPDWLWGPHSLLSNG